MSNAQDLCVKYVRDWNRIDKMIGCRHLSAREAARQEAERDRLEDLLFTARPESLADAGCLVQRSARALEGMITSEQWQSLLFIGARLKQGESSLADVVALRRAIAACEGEPDAIAACDCEPDAMEAGELDVIDADYKADVLEMLRRALGFVTRLRLV